MNQLARIGQDEYELLCYLFSLISLTLRVSSSRVHIFFGRSLAVFARLSLALMPLKLGNLLGDRGLFKIGRNKLLLSFVSAGTFLVFHLPRQWVVSPFAL